MNVAAALTVDSVDVFLLNFGESYQPSTIKERDAIFVGPASVGDRDVMSLIGGFVLAVSHWQTK